jgi:hypothetical protein
MSDFGVAIGVVVAALGIGALVFLWAVVRRVSRRNTVVADDPRLWLERERRCPDCDQPMAQGYVLAGKGLIWRPRAGKGPGTFAHIGQALPNTMSFGLPPALNMAWRCEACGLIMLDLSKMVRRR